MKSYIGRCDLQNIEALNRLQNIEAKGYVINYNKSYNEIEIKPNSVIYCDIPYKNTATYNEEAFDYDKFYDWALRQTELLIISEYEVPSDFICIAEKKKLSTMSATTNSVKTIERLYIPKTQKELFDNHKPNELKLF